MTEPSEKPAHILWAEKHIMKEAKTYGGDELILRAWKYRKFFYVMYALLFLVIVHSIYTFMKSDVRYIRASSGDRILNALFMGTLFFMSQQYSRVLGLAKLYREQLDRNNQ